MRTSEHNDLDSMFLERWSPRSFLSDPVSASELATLFEAARWSPSCFNEQPWRFVFASKSADRKRFMEVLVEGNRVWAATAPVLVLAFSSNHFVHNGKINRWAPFDAGAAWMALTLQANKLGLHCHAMGGFDMQKAYTVTGADPEKFTVLCAIAIGHQGPTDLLPEDLRPNEAPSDRRPQSTFAFEGTMQDEATT